MCAELTGRTAFVFPGQGSQYVGMTTKLGPATLAQQSLFGHADQALGFPLLQLIEEGPEDELIKTSNAQPALLVVGLAAALALQERGYQPEIVMGHSLGEYTALVFAGVIAFSDALKLVRKRGMLMEQAAKKTPGKMAAVIGADPDALSQLVQDCQDAGVLEITNFNSPKQVVLSGEEAAIELILDRIKETRAGRAMELNVSAPFHCSLMRPMAEEFKQALQSVEFSAPQQLFIDNVTGQAESDPERIRQKLVDQLDHPVQWVRSVASAVEAGATRFVECGPKTVLTGLIKRCAPKTELVSSERILSQE